MYVSSRAVAVVVTAVAFGVLAGTVGAQSLAADVPRGQWDAGSGTGTIVLDNDSYHRVFQGEEDVDRWLFYDGTDITGDAITGIPNGGAEGQLLDLDGEIPRTQRTGRYRGDAPAARATVARPEIGSLDLFNENGVKLGSSASVSEDQAVLVRVTWNYVDAEDVELALRGPDGITIEREALTDDPSAAQANLLPGSYSQGDLDSVQQGVGSTGQRVAYWLLDLSALDGGRHTLTVEGVDDLDFGDASRSLALNVGTQARAYISVGRSDVSRGERLRFAVRNGDAGQYHAVAGDRDDLRSGADPSSVFLLAGHTVETGSTSRYAYGVVRIPSSGVGDGMLDTARLDTGNVDVHLWAGRSSVSAAVQQMGDATSINRGRVTVEKAAFSLDDPITYTVGDEITLRGTASSGIDAVAMYVRDGSGNWELLPLNGRRTTTVRNDGTWVARDVVLSDEDFGGYLLKFPGVYQFAVVDAADLATPPPTELTHQQLLRTTNSLSTIRNSVPVVAAAFRPVRGEVAVGDRLGFTGSMMGGDTVVVVFVGDRGDVTAATHRATSRSGVFDVQIETEGLRTGGATAVALNPGADGEFGDGTATDADGQRVSTDSPGAFRDYVRSFDGSGRTGDQIVDRIRGQSVDERGSDDLIVTRRFRLASPRTTIADVVPRAHRGRTGVVPLEVGETAVVRGTTNRNPADAVIQVRVTDGPSASAVDDAVVERWDRSTGSWTASLAFGDVEPGRYTVEADDGESTDSVDLRVYPQGERPARALEDAATLRERLDRLQLEVDQLDTTRRQQEEEIEALRETRDRLRRNVSAGSGGPVPGQPGFGAVALLAAVAGALLVVRRRR